MNFFYCLTILPNPFSKILNNKLQFYHCILGTVCLTINALPCTCSPWLNKTSANYLASVDSKHKNKNKIHGVCGFNIIQLWWIILNTGHQCVTRGSDVFKAHHQDAAAVLHCPFLGNSIWATNLHKNRGHTLLVNFMFEMKGRSVLSSFIEEMSFLNPFY